LGGTEKAEHHEGSAFGTGDRRDVMRGTEVASRGGTGHPASQSDPDHMKVHDHQWQSHYHQHTLSTVPLFIPIQQRQIMT
jgi:hypothetical protein